MYSEGHNPAAASSETVVVQGLAPSLDPLVDAADVPAGEGERGDQGGMRSLYHGLRTRPTGLLVALAAQRSSSTA